MSNQLGVIGMGVMGLNLAMNAADHGYSVAVFNRTTARMENAVQIAKDQNVTLHGYAELVDFVHSLERPRKIILLVQAGKAVDATLELLLEMLESGDIIIDGGNEFYSNTDRRTEVAARKGITFFGMGVSGGEEGARHGPALMPGGTPVAYEALAPILKSIAAKSSWGECVDFMGNGSAGNYVKMVHNGIEYGDMELIAESYNLMKNMMGVDDNSKIAEIFNTWNKGRMSSYLIEITSTVLTSKHPDNDQLSLVDDILDVAGAKGTGKWTAQEACEKGIACPTIQAALDARNVSGMLDTRACFNSVFRTATAPPSDSTGGPSETCTITFEDVETSLFLSKLCSYAQGIALMQEASRVHDYNLDIAKVARCWTGGCIIRAELLGDIMKAYKEEPNLKNLLLAPAFRNYFTSAAISRWKHVVSSAMISGMPIPAMAASLNWFLMLSASSLPLNLVQAQRDYFGAHTFKLRSKEGVFHADWENGLYKAAP